VNKLGFYVENTTIQFLRDAFVKVKPPVLLIHAGDRGLLREIRNTLSPDTFVIGRLFIDLPQQQAMLTGGNPEGEGRALAERILNYDFGLAKERGASGRLLIDAWMSLNEPVPGPAAFVDWKPDALTLARYDALDRLQVAFLERLRADGLEGVAFNFAAGNFVAQDHVANYFPRSLGAYTYLGFHEYGWPTLMPRPDTSTSAVTYRTLMQGIRVKHGARHKVIITEAGLARMYRYPRDPAGDVGWLYRGETISEAQYWESLQWYNGQLVQDDYLLGACLFSVGHSGQWETFRHLGQDNEQRPILLMDKIATLRETSPQPPPPPPPPPPPDETRSELTRRVDAVQATMQAAVAKADAFTRDLSAARTALAAATQAAHAGPQAERARGLLARLDALEASLDALPPGSAVDAPATRAQIVSLRAQTQAALTAIEALDRARAGLPPLQARLNALDRRAPAVASTRQQAAGILSNANKLEADIAATAVPPTPRAFTAAGAGAADASPDEPALTGGSAYPARPLGAIRRMIIHHTGMRPDATPAEVAQRAVAEGRAAIPYHYLITGDGTVHQTQPLTARTNQSRVLAVDAEGVAIAFGGDFDLAVPTPAQMAAAADLLAALLTRFGLDVNDIVGRSEVERGTTSPGMQWGQGVRWRDDLVAAVAARLPVSSVAER
jgi:hypothetical protein